MQDDVPDKIQNNRRDAVGNARNVDAGQLHLRGKQRDFFFFFLIQIDVETQRCRINLHGTLTRRSSRKDRTVDTLFSRKMRCGDDLNL